MQVLRGDTAERPGCSRLVFIGDVHGNWADVEAGLSMAAMPPTVAVLLGDVECDLPLDVVAAPLLDRDIAVHWIHGNHDYDGGPEMWANLAAPERNPLTASGALHGRVVELAGMRVAGLGGTFVPQVWPADARPRLRCRAMLAAALAASRPELDAAGAAALAGFLAATAVWPEDVERLSAQRADVLVTHEAPSSHPQGVAAIDALARAMGARLIVHGHHHVTLRAEAGDGLCAIGVGDTWAVDPDGNVAWRGRKRDRPLPRPGAGWVARPIAA